MRNPDAEHVSSFCRPKCSCNVGGLPILSIPLFGGASHSTSNHYILRDHTQVSSWYNLVFVKAQLTWLYFRTTCRFLKKFSRRRSEHTDRNSELKAKVPFRTTPTHWEIITWSYRKLIYTVFPPCKVSNPTFKKMLCQIFGRFDPKIWMGVGNKLRYLRSSFIGCLITVINTVIFFLFFSWLQYVYYY